MADTPTSEPPGETSLPGLPNPAHLPIRTTFIHFSPGLGDKAATRHKSAPPLRRDLEDEVEVKAGEPHFVPPAPANVASPFRDRASTAGAVQHVYSRSQALTIWPPSVGMPASFDAPLQLDATLPAWTDGPASGWPPAPPMHAVAPWPQLGATVPPPPTSPAVVMRPSPTEVVWRVDSRKLNGKDKQAVSPSFNLCCGSLTRVAFKLMMYAKEVPRSDDEEKAGRLSLANTSFKKSSGHGYLQLKCETARARGVPMVVNFRFSIGDGEGQDCEPRGPVKHDFAERAVKGLPRELELWDFKGAVDVDSETFLVRLMQLPLP